MREMTVRAATDQVDPVTDFINEELSKLRHSHKIRIDVDVVVDELFSNIVRYAYGTEGGLITVRTEAQQNPPALVITFIDQGKPFNPLAEEQPDTTSLPLRERPIGGLGLFLVRQLVDDITYSYRDGRNILTVRKNV